MPSWTGGRTSHAAVGPPLVVYGAGGHARVVAGALKCSGEYEIVGFLDNTSPDLKGQGFCGRTILGGDDQLERLRSEGIRFAAVAVGDNRARLQIAERLERHGFVLPAIVHPQAIVYDDALLGSGTFIAPGAVVAANVAIGRCAIINHAASVDHDCILEDGVHLSPGARLGGRVCVGRATWIGLNAAVREKIHVGNNAVVAAGAVVIRDVADGLTVGGVPAHVLRGSATTVDHGTAVSSESSATTKAADDRARILSLTTLRESNEYVGPPLAILGGKPAFAEKLYVGRPNIPTPIKLLDRIEQALQRRWLTNDGPLVRDFEQRLSEKLGGAEVVAVSNATLGLQLTARALGLTGEVLMPAMTFVATAHAFEWEGVTPVFCDADPVTHNLDPQDVARKITDRTSAIVGVHLWGRPCAVQDLTELAQANHLKLIFDAAHAFGCSYGDRMIGTHGDAEVFSFHGTKFVNTLEGGAVATTNPATAESLRLLRNFGFAGVDKIVQLGTNAKMNEFSAAMGLACLDDMDVFVAANRRNYEAYCDVLDDLPGIRVNRPPRHDQYNYQYVVAEIDATECGLSRDELARVLWAENVIVRRYFYPGCHNVAPYLTRRHGPLPVTDQLCERVMAFPTGSSVSVEEVRRIGELVQTAIEHQSEIQEQLRHAVPAAA